jgi:hypothetical protein
VTLAWRGGRLLRLPRNGPAGEHRPGYQDHGRGGAEPGLPDPVAALAALVPGAAPDQVHHLGIGGLLGGGRDRAEAGEQVLHARKLGQVRLAGRAAVEVRFERALVLRPEQAESVGADVDVLAAHGLAVHADTPRSVRCTLSALSA